jgi:hypothetical protein
MTQVKHNNLSQYKEFLEILYFIIQIKMAGLRVKLIHFLYAVSKYNISLCLSSNFISFLYFTN